MSVIITGVVADSAGRPGAGRIEFSQVQRIDTGELLVTQAVAVAQVVSGTLQALDGSPFSLPFNPEGTAVRIREMLGGQTFVWWAAVPDVAQIEYRELPVVESGSHPESVWGPPPWLAAAEAARTEIAEAIAEGIAAADALGGVAGLQTLVDTATGAAGAASGSAASAAASAAAAAAAAESIDEDAINARFTGIDADIAKLRGEIEGGGGDFSANFANELALGATSAGALQLESYLHENVSGMPRTAEHFWYGHEMNPKWRAAVNAVKAGTAPAKILCIGDSTTYGTAASMAEGWSNQNSWPSRLAEYLDRHVAAAERGLAIPPSDGSSVPARTEDTRWTLGAGWSRYTTDIGVGLGGKNSTYWAPSPGAGYLDFKDPYIVADRFDVYYLATTSAAFGSFRAVVGGGGTPVDVVAGGQSAQEVRKVTVTAPTRAANQLFRVRNSGASGAIYIIGVEPWDSTRPRIRVGNAGSSGSTTTGWVAPQPSVGDAWNVFSFLKAFKPDLTIIDLGINDANPASPLAVATFLANMKRLADAAAAEGSAVLFKTMIPSGGERYGREAEYVEALKGITPRRAVLDVFNHYSYERNVARGWMNDSAHGNDGLYADEGDRVAEFLARYSGN